MVLINFSLIFLVIHHIKQGRLSFQRFLELREVGPSSIPVIFSDINLSIPLRNPFIGA